MCSFVICWAFARSTCCGYSDPWRPLRARPFRLAVARSMSSEFWGLGQVRIVTARGSRPDRRRFLARLSPKEARLSDPDLLFGLTLNPFDLEPFSLVWRSIVSPANQQTLSIIPHEGRQTARGLGPAAAGGLRGMPPGGGGALRGPSSHVPGRRHLGPGEEKGRAGDHPEISSRAPS